MKNINNKLSDIDGINAESNKNAQYNFKAINPSDIQEYAENFTNYSRNQIYVYDLANDAYAYQYITSYGIDKYITASNGNSSYSQDNDNIFIYAKRNDVDTTGNLNISYSQAWMNLYKSGSSGFNGQFQITNTYLQQTYLKGSGISQKFSQLIFEDTGAITLTQKTGSSLEIEKANIKMLANNDIGITTTTKITNTVNNGLATSTIVQNATDITVTTTNTYLYSSDTIEIDAPTIIMSNMKYGNADFVLDGVQMVFVIPHSLGSIPTSFALTFSDAGNTEFTQSLRTIDATNITITASNPPTGTMIVYWQVFK